MHLSRSLPAIIAAWAASATHAAPLNVRDLLHQAQAGPLLRIALPQSSSESYSFSRADIEAGAMVEHLLFDTRSNTIWRFDQDGRARGLYSFAILADHIRIFEGDKQVTQYPFALTVDAVVLPLDATPELVLPDVIETFASLGNGPSRKVTA